MTTRNTRHVWLSRRGRPAGFSLAEMMIVVSIMGTMLALATFSYIRYTESVLVDSAASTIDATIKSARQAAVATRTARRIVLDLDKEVMFTQRKFFEQFEFDAEVPLVSGDTSSEMRLNQYLVGETTSMRPGVDIIDVSGWSTLDFTGDNKYYCIEFDRQGRNARGYRLLPGRTVDATLNEGLEIHVGRRLARVVLPSEIDLSNYADGIEKNDLLSYVANLPGLYVVPKVAQESGTSAQEPLWSAQAGVSRLNDGDMHGQLTLEQIQERNTPGFLYTDEILRVEIARIARTTIHTVQVLPITGRVHTFPYGIGFPWSNQELIEVMGDLRS